jgi:uncharacterized protein
MKRLLLDALLAWKDKPARKPLLIDGARQTGKTYLLHELLGQEFPRVLRIDFLESPKMATAFERSLNPQDIVASLELLSGQSFNIASDLLILDEIGECPNAVTSLKFFAEKMPHAYVAASGSNIGLLGSFPVGKVEQHNLRPLTFREFLWATAPVSLNEAFNARANSEAAHTQLFSQLTDYYFTGGMPEAVATWVALANASMLDRIKAVSQIHADLVQGYRRDFGKYSGKADAQLIESVFNAVPSQLSAVLDESVQRFRFKGVSPGKSRYADFETAISWLHNCRLVLKNYPVEGRPAAPLAAYQKENRVKLFLFDTGLLNHMLGSSYEQIKQQAYQFKGFVAENFVQQELAALGLGPSFSWIDARAEIEFLIANRLGKIVPIEVKSGRRTRAKSLQSYVMKCQPHQSIKLTGTRGSDPNARTNLVVPLYYVGSLDEIIGVQ